MKSNWELVVADIENACRNDARYYTLISLCQEVEQRKLTESIAAKYNALVLENDPATALFIACRTFLP